jgi:alpha-N-acetylglucosaminidase
MSGAMGGGKGGGSMGGNMGGGNMGGNMGLVGSLDAVNRGTIDALSHSGGALAAIGIDPEGINTNPAYFEFVLASAWRAAPVDTRAWMQDFGVRRCGCERDDVRAAYALLHDTVYRANQTNFEHHMAYCSVALPLVNDTWDKTLVRPSFAASALADVWRLLLEGVRSGECSSAGVRYDLIDVAREFISLFPCVAAYDSLLAAATLDDLATAAIAMNDTLTDLDRLLGTHRGFMVGPWIADARALGLRAGASAADLDLLELNARAQISTWLPLPPTGENKLYDYANKQFSGLTKDYYLLRYSAFATLAAEAILSGGLPADVDQAAFVDDLTYIGQQWMGARAPASVYPTEPMGDALEVAAALYTKYAEHMAV